MCSKSKIGYYTWFILEDIRGILWIIMWGFPNDLYHLIHLFMVIWGMVCCWLSQWAWPHWPGSGSKPGAPGKKNIKIAGICGCSSPQNLRWWSMIYWSLLIYYLYCICVYLIDLSVYFFMSVYRYMLYVVRMELHSPSQALRLAPTLMKAT